MDDSIGMNGIDPQVFVQIAEATLHGVIITDNEKRIIYVNPAFIFSTGYEPDEVMGRNPRILQSGRHDLAFYRTMWHSLRTTGQWQGEIWNKRKNGEIFPEWQNISVIYAKDGSISHYVSVFSDITERKRVEAKLHEANRRLTDLAMTDELTGLANRRFFLSVIDKEWRRARRSKQLGSLLLVDVDYFKAYNDYYGHLKGDECLRLAAQAIRSSLQRAGDLAARYGGEEFAVILPETERAGAEEVAARIHSRIEALAIPHAGSPEYGQVTVSIGGAWQQPDDMDFSMLIKRSDVRLYQAKRLGRNRSVFED